MLTNVQLIAFIFIMVIANFLDSWLNWFWSEWSMLLKIISFFFAFLSSTRHCHCFLFPNKKIIDPAIQLSVNRIDPSTKTHRIKVNKKLQSMNTATVTNAIKQFNFYLKCFKGRKHVHRFIIYWKFLYKSTTGII